MLKAIYAEAAPIPARNEAVLITEPLVGCVRGMNGMPCLQLSHVVVSFAVKSLFQTSMLRSGAEWSSRSIKPALL